MDTFFSNIEESLNEMIANTTDTNTNNNDSSVLMQNQISTQQAMNAVLQESSALICGPSCQKEKITKELEQKMIDAETNLKTAPAKLEESRRNYFVFSQGERAYNKMQEKELKEKAREIANELTILFNKELTNVRTMNSYLNIATTNSDYTVDLLEKLLAENKELTEQLQENQTDIITNDRKTYYENEAIDNLELWYILFWRSFYFIYIILLIVLMSKALYWHAFASILLLFYPYYIPQLYKWGLNRITGFINKLPSNIYNNL